MSAEPPVVVHLVSGNFPNLRSFQRFLERTLPSLALAQSHVFVLSEDALGLRHRMPHSLAKTGVARIQSVLRSHGDAHAFFVLRERFSKPQPSHGRFPALSSVLYAVSPHGIGMQPKRRFADADRSPVYDSLPSTPGVLGKAVSHWERRGNRMRSKPFIRISVSDREFEGRVCEDIVLPSDRDQSFSVVPSSDLNPSTVIPVYFKNRRAVFVNDSEHGQVVYYTPRGRATLHELVLGGGLSDHARRFLEGEGIGIRVHAAGGRRTRYGGRH
ncbi:MAG: hypothetical protein V1787_02315 [Candidatus Micrarchaeota archaeon]